MHREGSPGHLLNLLRRNEIPETLKDAAADNGDCGERISCSKQSKRALSHRNASLVLFSISKKTKKHGFILHVVLRPFIFLVAET